MIQLVAEKGGCHKPDLRTSLFCRRIGLNILDGFADRFEVAQLDEKKIILIEVEIQRFDVPIKQCEQLLVRQKMPISANKDIRGI
ncbi:MAG: hypothetical protein WCK27_09995 [Verrucomicrobiota bacterium]